MTALLFNSPQTAQQVLCNAQRFEQFSREHPFYVGKLEPDKDLVFRERNVVVWYDAGSTSNRLDEVKGGANDFGKLSGRLHEGDRPAVTPANRWRVEQKTLARTFARPT